MPDFEQGIKSSKHVDFLVRPPKWLIDSEYIVVYPQRDDLRVVCYKGYGEKKLYPILNWMPIALDFSRCWRYTAMQTAVSNLRAHTAHTPSKINFDLA